MSDFKPYVKTFRVEHLTNDEIQDLITSYTNLGWIHRSNWTLGDSHKFISFVWNIPDKEPIYPE